MMKKIDKGFWYFCIVVMFLLCGYILWQCGFTMTYAENLENVIQRARLPFFIFGLAIAIGVIFFLASRILQKCSPKQLKWIAIGAFSILVLGQFLFLSIFRTALRGDQMKVFEAAIDLMESGTIARSSYNEYFSRCSNNIPMALITYLFVNIFKLLHLPQNLWMDLVKIIGTGFLNGGLIFGYLILKRLKGQKTAALMLLLAAANPMMYLLSAVYYSSTISLFFAMGAIYLYFKGRNLTEKKWRWFLLLGIFLGLGFKIRATAFICGIALAIYALLGWRNLKDVKDGIKSLLITLGGFVMVVVLFTGLNYIYVQADYTDTEYTMLHYVMMGANGNGTYNPIDAAYTQSFDGKEAKIAANKERLLERLEEMGPSGILELMGRKLAVTFSDGTDDYYDAFNGAQGDAGHLNYLNGSKKDFFAGYCHLYNTMVWMGIFASLIPKIMWKQDRKTFVILLSALGGIAFQLIWECGEAYSVPYIILFLILAAEGIDFIQESTGPLLEKKAVSTGAAAGAILMIAAAGLWIVKAFSGIVLVNDEYRVRQTTYELSVHSADEVVEQTFTASDPFNEIELYVYNVLKEHNHSIYLVTLFNENKEQIASELIIGYMLPEYGSAYVQFDTVIPDKESTYTIRIESAEQDERSGIVFPYHSTGIYDLYQGGCLYVNGIAKENCDLAFTVYLRTESAGI